jgi:hypothetical protein
MNLSVLVTTAGSIVAQGIIKSLKLADRYRIMAADMSPLAAGLYRCDAGVLVPSVSSPNYIESIIENCNENDVQALFCGSDDELWVLANAKEEIESRTGAKLLTGSLEALAIAKDLGISSYASGTGGIGYLVDGSLVSRKLGLQLPLLLMWPSRDVYEGIGQTEAIASMPAQDIDLYLQSLEKQNAEYEERIRPLLSKRADKIKAGEPADEILSQLFELKEAQRKIRQQRSTAEKIRNAVNLSPCFIDYAVNFGMIKTEKVWKNHLIKDGGLASPMIFQQT